ncbi:hypothetical protein GQ44DRAFT_699558 [Phaeosphaeriaceae sp. PMI808]|nr:hypothetical protein GQ44DRAFT_699558 [Phaeosphaeriaceae sp. PMI808]
MALFPAPSSTVPNATLTQQRLLQGLAATEFMGIDFDAEPPPHCLIREPSVPWSDIMKFSPVENVDPSGPCDTQIEVKTETLPRVSEQLRESFNPQQGSIEFGVQLTGSPLRVETFSSDNVGQKKGVLSSQATFSDKDLRQPSTPRSSRRGASGEGQQISQHQKSEAHLILDPEDPEVTSLPKEQYKPRPSRSRSLKMDTSEPVDYSVRPEKAVKRRKTTTTTSLGRSTREKAGIKTPQKVQMICEMGFTPISTGTALKQHSGDVAQSIDWLINNGMGKDELALPNTPKRKPTSKEPKSVNKVAVETPGKVSTNKEGGRISTAAEINVSKNRSVANEPLTRMTDLDSTSSLPDIPMPPTTVARSPHVQVVIPLKSPKSPLPQKLNSTTVSTAKTKRRKTPLEVSDSNSVLGTPIVPEVVIGKKKERGRPKKANNSVLPPNDGQFVSQETVEHQQESSEIVGDTESDPMVIPATHSDNAKPTATAKDTQIDPTISVSTSGQKNTPPPIIPHIPDKSTKSSSRSPTGKNRVTYRVGLSKRARIAPLLRTLKK